ncbi:MAG: T9SS type A sorting domain-containing protein [Flavobacteriaceae bacterium]|jgi:hypothetical protein|nr:T9SS type A sorting domain-containing protein [Flavobacteriaceae bacterium]
MKKIFTVLSAVALGIMANAQNLVQNPGFENGFTDPWFKGWNATYTDPTLVTTGAHAGTNCVAYIGATATTGFYQNVSVVPGHSITISMWYKASGDGTDARIWSSYLSDPSSTTPIYQEPEATDDPLRGPFNQYFDPAADWTEHTVTVTVPAGANILQLHVRAYNNGTAYFDDFSVIDNDATAGTTEVGLSKHALIKNTLVNNQITFAADANIQIINTVGQVVKSAKVTNGTSMDVSSLAKGVYIVTGVANGEKSSQKFIKQ